MNGCHTKKYHKKKHIVEYVVPYDTREKYETIKRNEMHRICYIDLLNNEAENEFQSAWLNDLIEHRVMRIGDDSQAQIGYRD